MVAKGTKKTNPKEVAFIENWINNYPKKCLAYESLREGFLLTNLNLKFGKWNKKKNNSQKLCKTLAI